MGRILFFVILAVVVWLLIRGYLRIDAKKGGDASAAKPPKPAEPEMMVICARCGVNLPRSSTREEAGVPVCDDNPRCRGPS